jgi:ribosomal protein L7/L12
MILSWIVFGLAALIGAFVFAVLRDAVVRHPETSPPNGKATVADIEGLVKAGRKIDAIRRYREIHHCSLAEARDAIDNYPQ